MTRNKSTIRTKLVNKPKAPPPQPKAPPPQPKAPPPQPKAPPHEQSMLKQMVGTVLQGFAFGTGSSIAHKAIDNLSTPNDNVSSTIVDYTDVLDNSNCKDILTDYNICIKNSPALYGDDNHQSQCGDILRLYNNCIQSI